MGTISAALSSNRGAASAPRAELPGCCGARGRSSSAQVCGSTSLRLLVYAQSSNEQPAGSLQDRGARTQRD